jgi:hypothetical protein
VKKAGVVEPLPSPKPEIGKPVEIRVKIQDLVGGTETNRFSAVFPELPGCASGATRKQKLVKMQRGAGALVCRPLSTGSAHAVLDFQLRQRVLQGGLDERGFFGRNSL